MWTLKGKDFCNCDHVQCLLDYIIDVEHDARTRVAPAEVRLARAIRVLRHAIDNHYNAEIEYDGNGAW